VLKATRPDWKPLENPWGSAKIILKFFFFHPGLVLVGFRRDAAWEKVKNQKACVYMFFYIYWGIYHNPYI